MLKTLYFCYPLRLFLVMLMEEQIMQKQLSEWVNLVFSLKLILKKNE